MLGVIHFYAQIFKRCAYLYKSMSKHLNVTISEDQFNKMNEMKHSPSSLLQCKINEVWENFDNNLESIKPLHKKLKNWENLVYRQRDFLQKHNLLEKFFEEENIIDKNLKTDKDL